MCRWRYDCEHPRGKCYNITKSHNTHVVILCVECGQKWYPCVKENVFRVELDGGEE